MARWGRRCAPRALIRGCFSRWNTKGVLLVDGFVAAAVPVEGAAKDGRRRRDRRGAGSGKRRRGPANVIDVIGRSFSHRAAAGRRGVAKRKSDVVISPRVREFAWDDFAKTPQLVAAGRGSRRRRTAANSGRRSRRASERLEAPMPQQKPTNNLHTGDAAGFSRGRAGSRPRTAGPPPLPRLVSHSARPRESGRGHAKSGFEQAVGDRKRVVEFGGTGEIAHAKCVEPVERARLPLAGDNDIHEKSLSVHFRALLGQSRRPRRQYNTRVPAEWTQGRRVTPCDSGRGEDTMRIMGRICRTGAGVARSDMAQSKAGPTAGGPNLHGEYFVHTTGAVGRRGSAQNEAASRSSGATGRSAKTSSIIETLLAAGQHGAPE